MPSTLAIDFGSRNIGIAVVQHSPSTPNHVLYAATLVVDAKWLNEAVTARVEARGIRRTRKTHKRRLRRLADALRGIPGTEQILRFCRRRGYGHDEAEEANATARAFQVPRAEFFRRLRDEIDRTIGPADRERVLRACSKHLNESRNREAELRPARFENRGSSRCQWEGCRHNVPRAGNDIKGRLQQALFAWLKPIFDQSGDPARLRRSIDHWIAELDGLAHWFQKTQRLDATAAKEQRRRIDLRKNRVYRNLKARVRREVPEQVAEQFEENWKETYSRGVSQIIKGDQGGRVRYCREHSKRFVDEFLAGHAIPNRVDVTEADLAGRKQQVIFARLWRLVESRLLPLTGGRIDRVVVERVAFDILAGAFKSRQKLSESRAAEMYWYGPQYGFANRQEMLRAEFDGRCAYCGQQAATHEVEHLLPRSRFPFDSYFNILPACNGCNSQKGSRTALEAGMRISPDAYKAYSDYVAGLTVPHLFHTMKKGMLNLLSRESRTSDVERYLGMLADNLVTISNTQKSPRPLARYLACKIEKRTGYRPHIDYVAGRHTTLYRSILLPEFDKQSDKEEENLINHAVDAIVLGCRLPSAAAFETPRWYARAQDILQWRDQVRAAGPALETGLPKVSSLSPVEYFETDLGNSYFRLDLSAFNWNRTRKGAHKLNPVGMTRGGRPLKRIAASEVLANLLDMKAMAEQIAGIAHRALRGHLQADPQQAPTRFVEWLQQSARAGLSQNRISSHPSDQARKRLLEEFVAFPAEQIVSGKKTIPSVIGVRCVNRGGAGGFDVARSDRNGHVFQHYLANPSVRELYVGYREKNGVPLRSKPVIYYVNQIYEVTRKQAGERILVDADPASPLLGRPFGSREKLASFLARWREAFDKVCEQDGIAKRFRLTQGCVIEKTDGTRFQLRNFDNGKPWIRGSPFNEIRRVYRSPFKVLEQQ